MLNSSWALFLGFGIAAVIGTSTGAEQEDQVKPSREASLAFLKKKYSGPWNVDEVYPAGRVATAYLVQSGTTDDELAMLGGLPEIEHVNLSGCPVTGRGMRHLAALKNLKRLDLSDTGIDNEGLAVVGKLASLEVLSLLPERITNNGLQVLSGLNKLRELDLRFTKITSEGLSVLNDLTRLEKLWLSFTQIDDSGLAYIASCQELQVLNLEGCKAITWDGVRHLKDLTKLRVLDLPGTGVDKSILPFLISMKSLRSLRASLSDADAEALLQANPKVVAHVGSGVVRNIDSDVPIRPVRSGPVALSVPEPWSILKSDPSGIPFSAWDIPEHLTPPSGSIRAAEDGCGGYVGQAHIAVDTFPIEKGQTIDDLINEMAPVVEAGAAGTESVDPLKGLSADTLEDLLELAVKASREEAKRPKVIRLDAGVSTLRNQNVRWAKYKSYDTELVTSYFWPLKDRAAVVSFSCAPKCYPLWQKVFDRILQTIVVDDEASAEKP